MTIRDVIIKCGGEVAVAFNLAINPNTVRHWYTEGIPEWYWRELIRLHSGKLTAEILHRLNEQVRRTRKD